MVPTARYGRERIRTGLAHFLLGKGLSSIGGFVYLILLARYLSLDEFAAYSVLQAFVEVFTAVTGFGLTHVILRYAPELYVQHENRVFRTFVLGSFVLRVAVLTGATAVAWLSVAEWGHVFGLKDWTSVIGLYLLVVWLRVNGHFLFQILESTLHQGLGQAAMVVSVLLRVVLVGWFLGRGELTIQVVVWIEVLAEAVGLVFLLGSVSWVLIQGKSHVGMLTWQSWWAEHHQRVLRYGIAGYLQHLAILPYGSAANRLVAGKLLDAMTLAGFGLAQSLADIIRRYLPAQLMTGLIRPVLVARYVATRNFENVASGLALVFRVNLGLLAVPAAVLLAVGPELVATLTNGKYGVEAAWLLVAMVGVLILESRRVLIDLAVQTIERNSLLVIGNVMLAASLVIAIFGVGVLGAMAIPLAAAVGLIASNAWITERLRREQFLFPLDLWVLSRAIGTIAFSAGVGKASAIQFGWVFGLVVVLFMVPIMLILTQVIDLKDIGKMKAIRMRND